MPRNAPSVNGKVVLSTAAERGAAASSFIGAGGWASGTNAGRRA